MCPYVGMFLIIYICGIILNMAKNKDNIESISHSLAHLMAMAITGKHPEVKLGIGPTIENGFYYDFDFSEAGHSPTEENLPKLENFIRELIKQDIKFAKEEISADKARGNFSKASRSKLELIDELQKNKKRITIYSACHSKMEIGNWKLEIAS